MSRGAARSVSMLLVMTIMSTLCSSHKVYGNSVDSNLAGYGTKLVDLHDQNSRNSVDSILDIVIADNETVRVGVDKPNTNYTQVGIKNAEVSILNTGLGVDVSEILKYKDLVEEEKRREEEEKKKQALLAAQTYLEETTQGGLVDIAKPDPNYGKRVLNIQGADRQMLEALVFGEAGNQGFIGAALVAQAIKDMYILGGYDSINSLRKVCKYSGSINKGTNQTVKDAVAYIFDEGGYAVKHRVLYFYAPGVVRSGWHESQNCIIKYKDHKFFDRWY